MSAFSRSWELVKASWQVLSADKELIIFPILSAFAALVVMIIFAVPGFFIYSMGGNEILGYALMFVFYLVLYTVIIFMNVALVGAAMIRLRGGDPTVSDGLQVAVSRFAAIVGYALISATVGMILQAISERGAIGSIVKSIIGTAWNVATYLVVPVLVVENVGPVQAIQSSTKLLKRTWGEQIAGGAGMGLVFFGFFLLATVLAGIGVFLGIALNSTILIVLFVVFGIVEYIALALLSSTLSGIYAAAVYRYAAEGQAGQQFAPALIQNTFRVR